MRHRNSITSSSLPLLGRRRVMTLIGAGILLPSAACSSVLPGQGPPEALYRLTPKSTFSPTLPEVEWQLVIETPVTNASLNTTRIALQRNATQVEYFAKAGWVDRAPAMIQTLIIESFENSERIVAVGRENIGLRSDFVLKVEVREFQAVYQDDAPAEVVVTMILKLVQMPRRAIIGYKRVNHVTQAQSPSLDAIIAAFDDTLGKVLKRSVEWTLVTGEQAWVERGVG